MATIRLRIVVRAQDSSPERKFIVLVPQGNTVTWLKGEIGRVYATKEAWMRVRPLTKYFDLVDKDEVRPGLRLGGDAVGPPLPPPHAHAFYRAFPARPLRQAPSRLSFFQEHPSSLTPCCPRPPVSAT